MANSRTKNSFLIMLSSGIRQILTLLLTFASRTVFIHILGSEYLGLNGLFSNILSILALSELGIGSAISFYLYKPIATKNEERIVSLMSFYKRCYQVVGLIILGVGSAIIPFLPRLVNFETELPVNLYLVYFLYLLNTASTYLVFAYKQTLLIADQKQYKIEKINIAFVFINCALDIVVLIIFRNYIAYLIEKLFATLLKNMCIAIKADKEYPFLNSGKHDPIAKTEKKSFFKSIGSVALFRIGSTLFNATDNLIISVMLGTVIVGYYSNYFMIISQIAIIINMIITSFSAGIGDIIARENRDKQYFVFKQLDFAVYFIAVVFTSCLFQLLNSFMKIWLWKTDPNYVLSQSVVLCLCISFYFDSTTQILNSFREGSGNFKTGSTLQIFGGITNIILSILLGKIWGLTGIFVATIISKGFVTVLPFTYNVGKDVFGKSGFSFILNYVKGFAVMIFVVTVLWFSANYFHMKGIGYFIVECLLALIIPTILLLIIYRKNPYKYALFDKIKGIVRKIRS